MQVNPLAEDTEGKLLAADAKLGFDDNAAFRQKELFALKDESQIDPREVAGSKYDLNYIGLDGAICTLNLDRVSVVESFSEFSTRRDDADTGEVKTFPLQSCNCFLNFIHYPITIPLRVMVALASSEAPRVLVPPCSVRELIILLIPSSCLKKDLPLSYKPGT